MLDEGADDGGGPDGGDDGGNQALFVTGVPGFLSSQQYIKFKIIHLKMRIVFIKIYQ